MKFDWSTAAIGATLAYSGLLMALVQGGLTGRIIKALGERRTAIVGLLSGIAGMILYALIPQGWMIYAVSTIGCLQGVAGASMNAIVSARTPANAQGELQGGIASANGLGSIIGPFLLTYTLSAATAPGLAHRFPGAAFALAAAISLGALLLFAWATAQKKPEARNQKPVESPAFRAEESAGASPAP
jgi:DHA1 family tetracycline resistance protein-like MFS transporter